MKEGATYDELAIELHGLYFGFDELEPQLLDAGERVACDQAEEYAKEDRDAQRDRHKKNQEEYRSLKLKWGKIDCECQKIKRVMEIISKCRENSRLSVGESQWKQWVELEEKRNAEHSEHFNQMLEQMKAQNEILAKIAKPTDG
jgi:hypothetical protein